MAASETNVNGNSVSYQFLSVEHIKELVRKVLTEPEFQERLDGHQGKNTRTP